MVFLCEKVDDAKYLSIGVLPTGRHCNLFQRLLLAPLLRVIGVQGP